jgi:hypothetical protein
LAAAIIKFKPIVALTFDLTRSAYFQRDANPGRYGTALCSGLRVQRGIGASGEKSQHDGEKDPPIHENVEDH